jgi:hypothetical protein
MRKAAAALASVLTVLGSGLLAGSSAEAAADRPNTLAGARNTPSVANNTWVKERISTATDEDWFRFDVPSATQLMVTLGGLPANYSLSVYDSAGRLIRTSNQSGVRYERILWTAPAKGTYYARVDAAGGHSASKDYSIRFKKLASGLVVVSHYSHKMANGHVSIMAEVKNTTSSWQRIQHVYADLQDASGRTLLTDLTSLSNIVLPPGGISYVNSASVVPAPAGYAKTRLRPVGVTVPAADANPKLTARQTGTGTSNGLPTYRGTVTSAGTTALPDQSAVVRVSYYDAFGNIRLTSGFYVGPIAARGTVPYNVTMSWAPFYPAPNRVATTAYVQRF